MSFTEEQLLAAVRARYRGNISLNAIAKAVKEEESLTDAVSMVVMECAMWDSPSGDPLDCTNLILTDEERQRRNEREDQLAIMTTIWNGLLKGHQKFQEIARLVGMQVGLRKYQLNMSVNQFLEALVKSGFLTNGYLEDDKILRINLKNPKFVDLENVRVFPSQYDKKLNEFLLQSWPLNS